MSSDERIDPNRKQAIELQPLELILDNPLKTAAASSDPKHQVHMAIPESPVHLCPNCKYNLTGLTSRICPECGEPFNILDARDTGRGKPAIGDWIFSDRMKLIVGRTLLVLACAVVNLTRLNKWPYVKWQWTYWGILVGIIAALGLWLGFLIKLRGDQSWPTIIFFVGVIVFCLALGFV